MVTCSVRQAHLHAHQLLLFHIPNLVTGCILQLIIGLTKTILSLLSPLGCQLLLPLLFIIERCLLLVLLAWARPDLSGYAEASASTSPNYARRQDCYYSQSLPRISGAGTECKHAEMRSNDTLHTHAHMPDADIVHIELRNAYLNNMQAISALANAVPFLAAFAARCASYASWS